MIPITETEPLPQEWLDEEIIDEPHETLVDPGFRRVEVMQPDGTTKYAYIPLTPEQFLHPKEGDRLPNNTFHDNVASTARDMLARRYTNDPTVLVFRDVSIFWDNPALPFESHCPDTCVILGVRNKHAYRDSFRVAQEGVRPSLVFEVVSPGYRKADRKTKVIEYAQAGVAEYVIVDHVKRHKTIIATEIYGYRLVGDTYQRIVPDPQGRILCETVGLWMSMDGEQLVMEDAATGERLLTSEEEQSARQAAEQRARDEEVARQAAEQRARDEEVARQAAEQRARDEEVARQAAEAELAELRARLQALQSSIDGETSGQV